MFLGKFGEDKATKFLQERGYTIIGRNFKYKGGEIDIVAQNGIELVFVEVKLRNNPTIVSAKEAVDRYKQKRIIEGAKLFMLKKSLSEFDFQVRFDVISIENGSIEWVKNAFT